MHSPRSFFFLKNSHPTSNVPNVTKSITILFLTKKLANKYRAKALCRANKLQPSILWDFVSVNRTQEQRSLSHIFGCLRLNCYLCQGYTGRLGLYYGLSSPEMSRFLTVNRQNSPEMSRFLTVNRQNSPEMSRFLTVNRQSSPEMSRFLIVNRQSSP